RPPSLLNDTASEMIYPLLPHFLLTALLGNRFALGVIEGVADAVASFVKLWSGGRGGRARGREAPAGFGGCPRPLAPPPGARAGAPPRRRRPRGGAPAGRSP